MKKYNNTLFNTSYMLFERKTKFKNFVMNLLERLISWLEALMLCSYNASNCSDDIFYILDRR